MQGKSRLTFESLALQKNSMLPPPPPGPPQLTTAGLSNTTAITGHRRTKSNEALSSTLGNQTKTIRSAAHLSSWETLAQDSSRESIESHSQRDQVRERDDSNDMYVCIKYVSIIFSIYDSRPRILCTTSLCTTGLYALLLIEFNRRMFLQIRLHCSNKRRRLTHHITM